MYFKDLQKCILGDAIKFVPVVSSLGNLSLFEITRNSALFFRRKICDAI